MELTEFFQEIKTPATILHVVGIVFGMGGAFVSDILFSFFSIDKKLNDTETSTLSVLSRIIFYSLILITLSGAVIFLSDTEKYLSSAKFLAKMSILAVLLINGYILNKSVWPHLLNKKFFKLKRERGVRRLAFVCGAISVTSWLSVFTLGILDSLNMTYFSIISLYLLITFLGVIVSLFVEKKELD
ncbi:hypothetical protein A2W67_01225 [Candidatus Nomurabacteria bacterium RIFCSPLOWO2_02_40_28]|uniref:Uncharacterized protein n=2 Tax=Candidatus Nomuraibacteriota TaxID=1752729 RepID=A0A837HTX2_9BACT|nr:MAG: hypothetical protein UT27_C0001G0071 [Candidatus Nomurabacteria bacterium GW2011_GWD2_39_12]KKR20662.1 MAG: hypothetical protein UT51_C0002G0097 [Candidatus Nomurabacteria bacterium GW2011_GWC2_39_41]KKR37409.1 MAG: hypothetical protein UT70_C0001G0085 [Candidatus Nomurabacteria bacterium GW2011_GWE2_40_10]KKR38657.1 MAG: hypothetical protein UT73_C0002G0142 [Candidatus Nomurabacteria bacterium GW2011_GWB1_40_11]KKR40382.1 MAG: hypothetical protein UT74_C0001G0116 [Parcubacteria group b